MDDIVLTAIPKQYYSDYRYEVIFNAHKWDPQVADQNTISEYVAIFNRQTVDLLKDYAEKLAQETVQMERALLNNLSLAKSLSFDRQTIKVLKRLKDYDEDKHIRVMRFDFHPTTDGFAISEVNSDVPGGFAEASELPKFANKYFTDCVPSTNATQALFEAFKKRVGENAKIAFVHCTAYADDRQVMECLYDYFTKNGMSGALTAPDHIVWKNREAYCILEHFNHKLDGIVRFFPLEWLPNLSKKSGWQGYYDGVTTASNHGIAILMQSKKIPLIWDSLNVDIPTWKKLLPQTVDYKTKCGSDFILKPVLGRVGEGISIAEGITPKEMQKISKLARRNPKAWLRQRRFESRPLVASDGSTHHMCIGVFTIDGKFGGFYGRINPYPLIDAKAKDIPILIRE